MLLSTPKKTQRPNINDAKKARYREKQEWLRQKKEEEVYSKKFGPRGYVKLIKAQPHPSLSVRVMGARGLNPNRPAILLNAKSQ